VLNLREAAVRWVARIWAGAVFLLVLAFFVEHLVEWFAAPGPWPPVRVQLLQACHLLLLVGLAVGWKWELAGGLLTLGSAAIFFGSVAGDRFPAFMAITAVPALIWIVLGLKRRPALS
jgi:hypothetical protein